MGLFYTASKNLILGIEFPELIRAVLHAGDAARDRGGGGGAGAPNLGKGARGQRMGLFKGEQCILRGGKHGFRIHLTDIFGNSLSGADADISAGFQIIHREDQFPCLVV